MKTLYFNDVKDFFVKYPHLIPEVIDAEVIEWDDPYELDPTYWFGECRKLVRDHILTFPGWKRIVQPETDTLIGFELDPEKLQAWSNRVSAFEESILHEYDYGGPTPLWDLYNLRGDDDVDYNGGYLGTGVYLILTYFEFEPLTKEL